MTATFTQRALTTGDAAQIAAVYAAMEHAEPVDELYSETDVAEELHAPNVDLAEGSVGIIDDGELVAFGLLGVTSTEPSWKATVMGGVLPQRWGQGIGRHVIDELETMAMRRHEREAPGRPAELKIYVPDKRRRTADLVKACGYEPWRYFFRMRRELAGGLPAVDVPSGVRIRRYQDADDGVLRAVSNAAFADHWGSSPLDPALWRAQFSASAAARPAHSWVAIDDGETSHQGIVGFVLSVEYDGDTELRGFRTGYLGRVGTLTRARGRGVASALIATTLEGMAADGYRSAELDVDAASPTGAGRIYERLGFTVFDRTTLVGKRW